MNKNPKSNRTMSSKTGGIWKRIWGYISLLITGAGIGWLVGLSVSPVISIVITSIIGSAAAIIAAISGLTDRDSESDKVDKLTSLGARSLDPTPIAALVIGLVIGSYFGILARTYDWLEPEVIVEPEIEIDMEAEIKKWTDLGLKEEIVLAEMFKREFMNAAGLSDIIELPPEKSKDGVLFAIEIQECDNLRAFTGDKLKRELATSAANPQLRELPKIIEDVDTLEKLVEKVLCPKP